jgi:hypothetical protein
MGKGLSSSFLSSCTGVAGFSGTAEGTAGVAAAAALSRSSASFFSAVFRYAFAVVLTALLGLQRSGVRGE